MYKYYKKYVPYLFLLPAAVILILFFFIPFFETIVLSFFDYNSNIYQVTLLDIENFEHYIYINEQGEIIE